MPNFGNGDARPIANNRNYVMPFTSAVRAAFPRFLSDLRGKTIEYRAGLLRAGEPFPVAPAGYAGVFRRRHRSILRDFLPVYEASCKMLRDIRMFVPHPLVPLFPDTRPSL